MAEGDKIEAIFEWEERPDGVSWVDRLLAPQATAQCLKWGLTPAPTLEENRVILKNKIREENAPPSIQTVQGPSPNWTEIVTATAQAVGNQIALALAAQPMHAQTPTVHPALVRDLANAAPVTNGAEPAQLLAFLVAATQLAKFKFATNQDNIIALLPRTTGQLRTIWSEAVLQNPPMPDLVQRLITTLLPGRSRQQLINDTIYKPQQNLESTAAYITRVREAAELLLPEALDTLDILITGLNPISRARLAGFPPPTSVEDLLALVPRMEAVRHGERSAHTDTPTRPFQRHYNPQWRTQQYDSSARQNLRTEHPSQFYTNSHHSNPHGPPRSSGPARGYYRGSGNATRGRP